MLTRPVWPAALPAQPKCCWALQRRKSKLKLRGGASPAEINLGISLPGPSEKQILCFRGPGVGGWCRVRVGSEGKRNAADRTGQQPGSCSAPPPGAASREMAGAGRGGWGDRNGRGQRLAGKGSPSLQGILVEQGQQGILLRKPPHKTKQNQNFIVPLEGLMPGNEWSSCPLPLGDKQSSAG